MVSHRNSKLFKFFVFVVATYVIYETSISLSNVFITKWSQEERMIQMLQGEFQKLTKLQKHLAVAHRYARSGTTIKEITDAYSLLTDVLDKIGIRISSLQMSHKIYTSDNTNTTKPDKLSDACPEMTINKLTDYPLFNKGIVTVNCSRHPFETLVSFIAITPNCSSAKNIMEGITKNYGKVQMSLGIESIEACDLSSAYKSFESLVVMKGVKNTGNTWRELLYLTSTKYVFVSRHLYTFNNESNIDRLLRTISLTGVEAVGGSERFEDGRWMGGCYQMGMRNYTLRFIEGYDLSFYSCMYCDYLSSSFLSKRSTLIENLRYNLQGEAVFVDYFIQLFRPDRIGAMSCVDVMFSSDYHDLNSEPRSVWQEVGRRWELNRFILPNKSDLWFTCEEVSIKCRKTGGEVVPPCCLKELSDGLKFIFEVCHDKNIDCLISGGTKAGALKFSGVLPWERDEDMEFGASKYKTFMEMSALFRDKGYYIKPKYYNDRNADKCAADRSIDCLMFYMFMKNWNIQMYGSGYLASDVRGKFRVPTQLPFDGMWMNTYTNPGHALRIVYGDDILQHVEHWTEVGETSGYSDYAKMKFGKFLKCGRPHFHGCLSNFLPCGNIQFKDFWI